MISQKQDKIKDIETCLTFIDEQVLSEQDLASNVLFKNTKKETKRNSLKTYVWTPAPCLSVCLAGWLSDSDSDSDSVSVSVCVSVSVSVYVCLSVSRSFGLSVCLFSQHNSLTAFQVSIIGPPSGIELSYFRVPSLYRTLNQPEITNTDNKKMKNEK